MPRVIQILHLAQKVCRTAHSLGWVQSSNPETSGYQKQRHSVSLPKSLSSHALVSCLSHPSLWCPSLNTLSCSPTLFGAVQVLNSLTLIHFVADHLLPDMTGQPACRLFGSCNTQRFQHCRSNKCVHQQPAHREAS